MPSSLDQIVVARLVRICTLASLTALGLGSQACRREEPARLETEALALYEQDGLTAADLVTQATIANEFAIRSSRLALAKGLGPATRRFAQMMIADHSRLQRELEEALSSTEIAAPAPYVAGEYEAWLRDLHNAPPDEFASLYLHRQLAAHERLAALFEAYARDGDVPEVQRWSKEALQTLMLHVEQARTLKRAHERVRRT